MKAIEVTGKLDEQGQLYLDQPINIFDQVLYESLYFFLKSLKQLNQDAPDDTPLDEIKASLKAELDDDAN